MQVTGLLMYFGISEVTRMWAETQRDGGALCSLPVWLTPDTGVPRSNAAKTRNPLKVAGVLQTTGPISAASGPKLTILWGHLKEILLLNKFFFRLPICALVADKVVRCAQITTLRPVFAASRLQHISDLHPKFALRPHHVCKYGRHPICDGWD